MSQPVNPFDELLGAWRRLSEESMNTLRQAFDAGSAQWQHRREEAAPQGAKPRSGQGQEQPGGEGSPNGQPQAQEQQGGAAQDGGVLEEVRALRAEVREANERLRRIEDALRELTLIDDEGGPSDGDGDGDGDGDDEASALLAELEDHLRRLKKNKGKKRKR